MDNSHFDSSGRQFAWDSTSIGYYAKCPRYYQYTMIEQWTSVRKSVHLDFGGWYATCLEHYYKYRAEGIEHEEALRSIVREALFLTWKYDEVINPETGEAHKLIGSGSPWVSDHNTKTRENLIRTIIWYFEQFKDDPFETVILANGKPGVELSFKMEVDDGIILSGHIDRLINYSKQLFITDQKTTATTISSYYFDQFKPSIQMGLYTIAGKVVYDAPISGVIIDAAQLAVGFTRFERGFLHWSAEELDEVYETLLGTIHRARKDDDFLMNPVSCGNYGGCEFRRVCSVAPKLRKQALESDFVKRVWNPLIPR